MILDRVSSSGAWRDTDSVNCNPYRASLSILSTRPQVDREMWRMPMFIPSGWFTRVRNRITVSKLSRGSPMPMSTMLEMGAPAVYLGEQHLVDHLRGGQVPHLARQGGGAEGAPHAAAHLAGDTHGVPVLIAHEHRLHAVAVGQLPQVFDGAVQLGYLLPGHLGRRQEGLAGELLPQRLGQVGHLVKGGDAPVEPVEDLLGPEGGLSPLLEPGGELLQGHGFDIGHASPSFRSLQM